MRLPAIMFVGAGMALAGPAAAQVTVSDPWFRFVAPPVPAGGYMILHNAGAEAAELDGASSQSCGSLMPHRTEQSGGTDRMVMAGPVVVPPGGSVAFAPGGYHMMCEHPAMTPGQTVTVTLRFKDGATLTTPSMSWVRPRRRSRCGWRIRDDRRHTTLGSGRRVAAGGDCAGRVRHCPSAGWS